MYHRIQKMSTIILCALFISMFSFSFVSALFHPSFEKLLLPSNVTGASSLAFDLNGGGPYVAVTDGRILKYGGPKIGFQDFAFTSANRSEEQCDGRTDFDAGPVCGSPIGLAFNYRTNELYITDAYFGLMVVGPNGNIATQLAITDADGLPFTNTNSVDVDTRTGTVYFTDTSTVFQNRNLTEAILSGDSTGRLLKYDPKTKQVSVLMTGLSAAVGNAISADGSFVIVSELIGNRTRRFWLKGPKANTSEVFSKTIRPGNIKRAMSGDFWLPALALDKSTMKEVPVGQKINKFGKVVRNVNLDALSNSTRASEVLEFRGALFIALPFADFIGVYKLKKS